LVEPCDINVVDLMDKAHAPAPLGKKLGVQDDSNDMVELVAAVEFMPLGTKTSKVVSPYPTPSQDRLVGLARWLCKITPLHSVPPAPPLLILY
jgi:hypothetical protein